MNQYCLYCANADVDMDEDSIRVFCQVKMEMVRDITCAFMCVEFQPKESNARHN